MDCQAILTEMQQKQALYIDQTAQVQAAQETLQQKQAALGQTMTELQYLNYLFTTYCQGA